MIPYRQIIEEMKASIETRFPTLQVFAGHKMAVARYPSCGVTFSPAREKPQTIGGGKTKTLGVTLSVMVKELTGKENGYLALTDLVSEVEDAIREPDFLESYTAVLVETEFVKNPVYLDNTFIVQAQLSLQIELNI
ncbi:MAG TPA: hypothetical protein PKV16_04715 [Caldisericia bacterium]|nr:hypothetical protein [Caldisericia bacterium]HPF48613.1 hypothetical protein [Caldisericia bacterium]HPI83727.1 hypothetical protein [Caldisericia bacterium]HPQ93068.1 hypothetical protein [Caldisericia bacterium]HRV75099.1 hypothetical protein [Caldisericia bacterium]